MCHFFHKTPLGATVSEIVIRDSSSGPDGVIHGNLYRITIGGATREAIDSGGSSTDPQNDVSNKTLLGATVSEIMNRVAVVNLMGSYMVICTASK